MADADLGEDGEAKEEAPGEATSGPPAPPEPHGPIARAVAVWRNPAYRFVLTFLPYLAVISVGYPLFVRHYNPVVQWFILRTAQIEYLLFSLVSDRVEVQDKLIFYEGFSVRIIDECTGIYEMLIFTAAVLAFPTSWAKRGLGILMGCPLIYVFNVARIAMLIFVGRFWKTGFDFMHLYFWQATMIVMITAVWLLWISLVVRYEKVRTAAPA